METFIERNDAAFGSQLDHFAMKIDLYVALLSLDSTKVANLKTGRDFFLFTNAQCEAAKQYSLTCTAYKNGVRRGLAGEAIGPVPVPPVWLQTPPPVVDGSIQAMFADLIQDCVHSRNFTTAIATDLGILKPAASFVPEDGRPVLYVTTAQGGHPLIHVRLGKYEGYEIWKDSGDNQGYKLLNTAFHPDYLDLSALPAHASSASWKYKVIYRYQNAQAGSWSNDVVIGVYGSI